MAAQPKPQEQPFADAGALLAHTHELPGEEHAKLRLTRPSDADRVRAFLESQSAETLRLRFFSPMPEISESTIRHFTFYDPRLRLVLAATIPGDRGEDIIGLADVVLVGTGLAELGLVVGDGHQGHGVGRLLSEAIASLAVRSGATHLKAEMLAENAAMLALMSRLGPTVRSVETGSVVVHTKLPARSAYAA